MLNSRVLSVARLTCSLVLFLCHLSGSTGHIYSNEWAVHIKGGYEKAKNVAERNGFVFVNEIMPDHYSFYQHKVGKRSTEHSEEHHHLLTSDAEVLWAEQQRVLRRVKRDKTLYFNDEYWEKQWYLYRRPSNGRLLDMNILPAWKQGITGRGTVVTILDDGIEKIHPDLRANYDPRASTDVNGRDTDPSPRYEYTNENRHGTRCAGEVAAAANNSICGVGIAYQASIGGIRMLDGDVTDTVEATSLSFNRDHIDIYSASWGPDDDGATVDGPGSLARKAFRDGITLGRKGKGSLFVWASGNGGRDKDNCNCDGYTNSIYTLSISSATENGHVPWYSEACSSTLASTYSSGGPHEQQVVTTDLRQTCTKEHTGTSASAPLAAGIVALVLQANPALTWRDMQYLVVLSSNPNNLQADDWVVNGVGRRVSHHFGYGIMNAGKMVELAKNWTAVPAQRICEIVAPDRNRLIHSEGKLSIKVKTNGCEGTSHHVMYLEHVQAKLSLTSSYRGDVTIYLTSPMGTKSTLLSPRANDNNNKGFNEWEFMTTHNWGEYSTGEWILEVENGVRAVSTLHEFILILHGTDTMPHTLLDTSLFTDPSMACAAKELLYRNECVKECPAGWYGSKRLCQPCHVSCASCVSYTNNSCTECYYGSLLFDGGCLSAGNGIKIDAGASLENKGLAPNTLWWLMVGATTAVCLLVIFLVLLSIYYAYTQRYLCSDITICGASNKTSTISSNTTTASTGQRLGMTPEHAVLTSQNSSQQELMTSEDEGELNETRKFRRYIHQEVV
ncbi:furin-like protease kpc-1 [Watersipora subatra]|uniref:furin-like protease kpc-1 n=1 Tax=Watersipora subatra TaxID=2589382 RepID=UPI00355C4CA1